METTLEQRIEALEKAINELPEIKKMLQDIHTILEPVKTKLYLDGKEL